MAGEGGEKKRGRKPWDPDDSTRRDVRGMAQLGMPHAVIGNIVGCDAKTLRKHCAEELAAAKGEGFRDWCNNLVTMSRGQRIIHYRDADTGEPRSRRIDLDAKTHFGALCKSGQFLYRRELEAADDDTPEALDDTPAFTINVMPDRGATGEEDDPPVTPIDLDAESDDDDDDED